MADTRTMRTRKPVSASGPACHRCTGLLAAGTTRCAICGWPAGVGYPPADGELEGAVEVSDAAAEPEEDHAAVQLDALSGLAERRTQPLSAQTAPEPATEPEPAHDVSDDTRSESTATTPDEADAPAIEATSADDTEDSSDAPREEADDEREIDPLTAPIEALTEDATIAHEPQDEPTPIADEVAAAVPAAEVPAVMVTEEVPPIDESPSVAEGVAASRAPKLARVAQLLIVTAAMFNLLVAAISAVAGSPVDASLTPVVLGVSLMTLAIWAGSAVVFLHWLSRAYAYVISTSAVRQRHGANMALAGWFIPILGLLIGYRVLQDLWSGSDPNTRDSAESGTAKARSVDVWLLGIATSMIFGYAMPLALGESALWNGLAALGVVVAGLALASTIGTISAWQSDLAPVAELDEMVDDGTVTTRVDELTAESVAEPVDAEPSMAAAD